MPYLGGKEYVKLRELVLAFVNAVSNFNLNTISRAKIIYQVVLMMKMQAMYHLPSLGQKVDFTIVYMEFQEKAPATLINSGDRGKLLDS
jgi:hypothetical protein